MFSPTNCYCPVSCNCPQANRSEELESLPVTSIDDANILFEKMSHSIVQIAYGSKWLANFRPHQEIVPLYYDPMGEIEQGEMWFVAWVTVPR